MKITPRVSFGKAKLGDELERRFGLKEAAKMPGPGAYRAFSDFGQTYT